MRLTLSRASPEDYEQLIWIMYEAFDGEPENGGDLMNAFFGRQTETNNARAKKELETWNTPESCWMKIVDEDAEVSVKVIGEKGYTGEVRREKRIACASFWKFFPTYVATGTCVQQVDYTSYLMTNIEREDGRMIVEGFYETRLSLMQEPHVLCFVLATAKAYEGRGCGRTMMNWGCGIADAMMLPCYLEATDKGCERIYNKIGFVEIKKTNFKGEVFEVRYTNMIRRPKGPSSLLLAQVNKLVVTGG